ncbi:MAG: ADOP family duplicated permease [Vicinamibacterales bacterium]
MTLLHRLASILRWMFRRDEAEDDLDAELRAFVEMAAADRMRDGVPADEARRLAVLHLGGVEQAKERVRAGRHGSWLDDFGRDVRHGVRTCLANPGFSAVVVVTLALAVGATTAVFTIVDGVLLRPLPYRDPDRLVTISYGHEGRVSPWLSPPNVRDYVGPSGAFTEAAAVRPTTASLTGAGEPERLAGARVSWNYFRLLGAPMALGRAFAEDDGRGDGRQVVLSDGLWRRRFGGRPDVVNSTATLDGHDVTIIGVAPATVRFPPAAEFWQPLIFTPADLASTARGAQSVQVLARLKDTVSPAEATTALQTMADRLAVAFPESEKNATVLATPMHERIVGDLRPTVLTLFGSVVLVLLVACANVASLLLVRGQARAREVAVRAALGASRRRLVAQFLTESLVLGTVGGVTGAGVAAATVRAVVALGPASLSRLPALSVDLRALALCLAMAFVTTIACGLAPALAVSRRSMEGGFPLSSRRTVGAIGTRARRIFVVSELAGAAMLLVVAGLLMRSYVQLQHVDPGFDPANVTTFTLALPAARYADPTRPRTFVSSLLSRLGGEPGVEGAAVAMGLPFTSDLNTITGFRHEGQPEPDSASKPTASLRVVSSDYFRLMRIPVRRGRSFDARDTPAGPDVVLINEQTARRYFPDQDPIGQQIRISAKAAGDAKGPKTIIGVVGDIKYGGLDEQTPAELYLAYEQHPVDTFSVVVRAAAGHAVSLASVRQGVAGLDPLLPLANVADVPALVDRSLAERRFTTLVILTFAAMAAALAVIGVYGLLAYLVSQRRGEVGLRLAVGAAPSDIVWLFVREGAALTVVGLTAGLVGALAAGRMVATLLFGVTPADPATLAAVVGLLAGAAACATYLPARRAAGVDPNEILKAE